MNKLKAALVGCGNVAQVHLKSIAENDKAELVSVCDIVKSKADKESEKYSCRGYYDFDEMIEKEKIDVLHITTPHYLHPQMAIKAMKKGVNVLTEKPMAIEYSDALKMCETAEKNNVHLGVCFQNRYNSTSVFIKEKIESGEAGKLIGMRGIVNWRRDKDYFSDPWHGTLDKEGGGVVINQSIHTIDLMQWLASSDVKKVSGSVSTKRLYDTIETEDTADAYIEFENGVSALFFGSLNYVYNAPVFLEVVCENMRFVLEDELNVYYKDGHKDVITFEKGKGRKDYWGINHAKLIDEFYNSVINGRPFFIDGREGAKAVKIVDMLYKSARKQTAVKK